MDGVKLFKVIGSEAQVLALPLASYGNPSKFSISLCLKVLFPKMGGISVAGHQEEAEIK